MAEFLFLNSPFFLPVAVGIIAFAGLFLYKKYVKKEDKYEPEKFTDTVNKDLKKSIDLHGEGFPLLSPGKLYLGMKEVGMIDKYYYGKGKFAVYYYDDKKKDLLVEDKEKDETYDLLYIRLKGASIIQKILGIGKFYVVVKNKDSKGKNLIEHDPEKRRILLPKSTHLLSYGDVWHNCADSIEYINDIALKRLNEVVMTHLQSFPDKVILFDEEQLKRERLGRIYSEIESAKWERRKNAEDTVIQ